MTDTRPSRINGKMEKWKNGKMEKWKNGKMEKWKNGKMEKCQFQKLGLVLSDFPTGFNAFLPKK
jgi:hypothetical protein